MKHFLLVYDRRKGALMRCDEIESYKVALKERFDLERSKPEEQEVVVLSSPSRENLERTHGRYFRSVREQLASAAG